MGLSLCLCFEGQCEVAVQFYKRCLGGKIEAMMTHEGSPAGYLGGWCDSLAVF